MPTTADVLVDTLISWEVSVVFGLPGDGINGIMEALRTRQEKIAFVQVRHEESAAFMATAYAKWTGKLGVCLATSGPGGTHLLTGLYDAKLDQAPVLAITGQQFHDLIETFTQQDVDLTRVFNDAAGIAFPRRPIFAVVGDGGFAMQPGEFSTAVRYRIPLKVLVIKNGMLNQIAWEQMMFLGNPQFGCELQPIDFAKAAEAMGGRGFTIRDPAEVEAVLDQALAAEGPVVIEAVVDAYEPMMPAKMPPDYAANFRKALPETPGRERIEASVVEESAKTMMEASS